MKLNTKKLTETKVITHPKYPDVKVTIRPFSLFSLNQVPSAQMLKDIQEYFNIFNYAVISWEGVFDEKNKILECDKQNKQLMFDSDFAFATDVVHESISMRNGLVPEEERKNLQTSPTGEEHLSER